MSRLIIDGCVFDTLVGHTGFVGRNLIDSYEFTHLFNSSNSSALSGLSCRGLVCAGLYAQKWRANVSPEEDLRHVKAVFDLISASHAEAVLLISTIDIYDPPLGSEGEEPDPAMTHPYGRHRQMFERWVQSRFPRTWILRLPALFGPHLKKNIVFDMLHDRLLENINPDGRLQWVDIRRLQEVLTTMDKAGINVLNMVTEPISSREIQQVIRPGVRIGTKAPSQPPFYDIKTKHSAAFGRDDGYIYGAETVLTDLQHFIAEARIS